MEGSNTVFCVFFAPSGPHNKKGLFPVGPPLKRDGKTACPAVLQLAINNILLYTVGAVYEILIFTV
jgi:hypothetical protein